MTGITPPARAVSVFRARRASIGLSPRVKVLYIDRQGRSGSTLLHNFLGQVEGFFAGGELREFWRRISDVDRPFGCGPPQSGALTLRLDEKRKEGLSQTDRTVITASTWPLLLRYGYHR